MKPNLPFTIAIGLLVSRLKQSIVAGAGVTFGVGLFVTMLSFMNGLNQMLDGLMLNRTPHVLLYNEIKPLEKQPLSLLDSLQNKAIFFHSIKPKDRGKEIYNSSEIIRVIKKDHRVIGVAPKANAQVFFNSGTIEIAGIVNGIEVASEELLFSLSDYLIAGNLNDLNQQNTIVIGKGLADKMMLTVGNTVKLTTASGTQSLLKIVGISQVGIAEIDNTISYTSLGMAQKLLGKSSSYITDIQVKLKNIAWAPAVAKEYKIKYNTDTLDYQTANSQFETGTRVRNIISYAVGITLLVVAGFGIYNILNMLIYEKMDSIAILKAIGFSGKDVRRIFIYLSLMIGIAGGLLGLLVGLSLSLLIDAIPFKIEALPTITTYPVYYNIWYYIIGITFALLTSFIAGLFPALKASKIDPVEIIRGK
jgi:lipoprotein-releasing system permease protein